jgi:FkbH-like protein
VRRHAVDAIRETDQRGILHSIASKNNPDDALAVLAAHGLRDYFLYPQIGWQPKSEAIARIAALLNIGVDSIAFIDDQRFEREEVAAALPAVALLDAADCAGLQQRAECQVPVTAESRRRRQMYREQEGREVALETYRGDYVAFLRECRLDVALRSLDDTSLERVYELAQRTNQMNFSGNRYPESQLRDIAASPAFETYVVECRDRFGDYGIVGFALVDAREARLVDLMFSCRIQAKRVEHAVLAYLLRRFVTDQHRSFFADFRRTPRNAAAGGVFDDMGFTVVGERDGVTSLVFREGQDVVDEGIVTVRYAVHTADAPVAGTIA